MEKDHADEMTTALTLVSEDHGERSPLVEITAHIRADQSLALEMLENSRRQRSGRDFDKDQLIQEALDLLIEKSFVAIRLGRNTADSDVNRKGLSKK